MFADKLTDNLSASIRPHLKAITDALYFVGAIAVMIFLALIVKLCPR